MKETIEIDGKRLSVIIEPPTQNGRGYALSLHGGGLSTKEAASYLSDCFTDRGFGWVTFDFSGWGESSGHRDACSLSSRLDDALGVIRHYALKIDVLVGTSMGGPIALKLLAHIDTPNLILFCPAAYAVSAWQQPFGNGFTENIRRENSFLETDAGIISAGYPGNVLYFIGDRDEVIPPAIDRLYNASFRQARSFRRVQIDNCPHPIHRWAASTPEVRHTIRAELSRFIDATVPHVAPSRP